MRTLVVVRMNEANTRDTVFVRFALSTASHAIQRSISIEICINKYNIRYILYTSATFSFILLRSYVRRLSTVSFTYSTVYSNRKSVLLCMRVLHFMRACYLRLFFIQGHCHVIANNLYFTAFSIILSLLLTSNRMRFLFIFGSSRFLKTKIVSIKLSEALFYSSIESIRIFLYSLSHLPVTSGGYTCIL